MRKLHLKYFVLILMFYMSAASADNSNIKAVFDKLKESKNLEAIDQIHSNNKWLDKNSDNYAVTRQKFDAILKQLGKFRYYELVASQEVGSRYSREIYIVGYERQPIYLIFNLYKPDSEWFVLGLSWRTELSDLSKDNIDLSAKTHNNSINSPH